MMRKNLPSTKNRAVHTDVWNRKAVLARSVAMVALLAVTGCSSVSSAFRAEPDPSVKLAGIFLAAGAADAALRAADEALVRQPRNPAALQVRADALSQMGEVEEAQRAYGALIAANPSDVAPRIALGRMLVQTNPAAAEQVFADVLVRQPKNAIAMNNIGIARDLQGRHAEAQASYRAARAVDPQMTGASVNLGLSQVLAGDMNEAVSTLTPLAALDDAPPAVHENLGIALAARGETAEARRVMSRVMSPTEITEALAQYRGVGAQQTAALSPRPAASASFSPAALPPVRTAAAPVAAAPPAIVAPAPSPVTLPPVAAVPVAPLPVPVAALAVPAALVERVAPAPAVSAPAVSAPAVSAPVAAVPESAPTAVSDPAAEPLRQTGVPVAMPIAPGTPGAAAPPSQSQAARPGAAYAQLALTPSAGRARARWDEIRASQESLLGDRRLVIAASSFRDQAVWAVRTGPFATPRQAESFCLQLRSAGQDCWAVVPTPDGPAIEATQPAPVAVRAPDLTAPVSAPVPPPAAVAIDATSPPPLASGSVAAAQPTAQPIAPPARRVAFAQLAASDSEAGVVGEWERLRRKIGPLLRDRQEITMAAEVAGRQVWRLRTGPFEQPREAEAFCAEVRAAGGKCWAAAGS